MDPTARFDLAGRALCSKGCTVLGRYPCCRTTLGARGEQDRAAYHARSPYPGPKPLPATVTPNIGQE